MPPLHTCEGELAHGPRYKTRMCDWRGECRNAWGSSYSLVLYCTCVLRYRHAPIGNPIGNGNKQYLKKGHSEFVKGLSAVPAASPTSHTILDGFGTQSNKCGTSWKMEQVRKCVEHIHRSWNYQARALVVKTKGSDWKDAQRNSGLGVSVDASNGLLWWSSKITHIFDIFDRYNVLCTYVCMVYIYMYIYIYI